jgi:rod shape-determining protein MreB
VVDFTPFGRRLWNSIGVDLGTGSTRVHVQGRGVVLDEPSVVAIGTEDGSIRAVGQDAKQMLGRTPASIQAIRPLWGGAIADVAMAEEMLRRFLRRAIHGWLPRARVHAVVAVPTGLTELQRRAIRSSAVAAGARKVDLIAEPIAAAIGVGLEVDSPTGHVIADIGGGTTRIGIVALGGIIYGASIPVAGDSLDQAVAAYIRRQHGLLIGDATAEQLKIELGSALPEGEVRYATVRGRDLVSGLPKSIELSSDDVRGAIQEPVEQIVEAILRGLEQAPPELAGDIVDRGITLIGGGALLPGLDRLLVERSGLPIQVAEEPTTCVVRGTARMIEQFDRFGWVSDS